MLVHLLEIYYNNKGENMNIMCIGHAAYDTTLSFPMFPLENTKNRVSKKVEGCGGCACCASYQLALWGLHPYFIGTVGNDYFGNRIQKELDEVGVNIEYLNVEMNYPTTNSLVVVNQTNGSRTIYTYVKEDRFIEKVNLEVEPDFMLMDGYEPELCKKMIKKYPNAISVIDAGRVTKDILELCKMVNYVVCSKEFLEEVTEITLSYQKKESFIQAYRKLEELVKTTLVVTLEENGTLYKYKDQVKIMPSMKVKAVDTTGAGDVFHATFLYGLYKNLPFEEIIKISNIAGALSVTKMGGTRSIPTCDEMKKVYHDFE